MPEEGRAVESLRCAHCRDVIGVYEPITVVLPDGTARSSSRLLLDDEPATGRVFHERCHRAAEPPASDSR
jgi:hypothetical protein